MKIKEAISNSLIELTKSANKYSGVIYLTGFMASGKTQTGRLLANTLDVNFFDLDTEIQIGEGKTIAEIFNDSGEDHFRQLESGYLKALPVSIPCVIATGGGTPTFNDNLDYINNTGLSIFIDSSFELIWLRLQLQNSHRPLTNNIDKNKLKLLYDTRRPIYLNSHKLFIYNDNLTQTQNLEYILKLLN